MVPNKILKFNDYNDIEYRKGSKKFGGLLLKLMEFLRIHKDKEENSIEFNIIDFEKESNITINEIKELLSDDKGKNLYKFDIQITDDKITFTNLTSDKSRYFESFEPSIRQNYEIYGVEDFYKKIGSDYKNPHSDMIKDAIIEINSKNIVDFSNVLDLASGMGEVTSILKELGYNDIVGCDPYLYNEYMKETGKKCYKYSFEDIQQGKLDNKKYSTIVCSYALHLAEPSIISTLMWKLSLISEYFIIISPNNNPIIKENNGWELINSFRKSKSKIRIYTSENNKLI